MKNEYTKWLINSLFVLWIFFILGSFFVVQKPFTAADFGFIGNKIAEVSLVDWGTILILGAVLSVGRRRLPIKAAGLIFVLGLFLILYKPFTLANFEAISNSILNLLTALWLGLIALGLGDWLLRRLSPNWLLLERFVLGTSLGLGFLGLLSFGCGLLGLFSTPVAYGVTILLTLFALPQLLNLRQQWSITTFHRPNPLIAVYLSLITIFTLLVALLPPTDWDGLFYHLTGPKLYLDAGQISGGIDIPHLSFPSLMEMLFAWAMLLRGDIAAKLLHTLFAFLLAGLVYLITVRFFNRKSAWPALLILTSMPMISTLAGWAYNDVALAFYQLAAMYTIINWRLTTDQGRRTKDEGQKRDNQPSNLPTFQSSNLPWLILTGIFIGLAMGLKYTSFVTPLVIAGLLVWWAVRGERDSRHAEAHEKNSTQQTTDNRQRTTDHIIPLLIVALTATLVALPWYVKNWLFTGNPVYPFLFDFFGGQFWDGFRADWYAAAGTGIGWRPLTLLALPWLLTLGVRDVNYWDGRTGPLLLLFLPLMLAYLIFGYFQRSPNSQSPNLPAFQPSTFPPAYTLLLTYALAHFIIWTLGVIWSRSLWQSRLLLPGLVALAPVAGWLWLELPRFDTPHFSISRFVNIAITLTLALTLVDVGLLTMKINPLPYIAGIESRDEYLTRRLGGHYAAMQQLNDTLPPEATVVFLWEPRSYYCRRDCRPDSILDEFPHLVDNYGSAETIVQTWRERGITHVLVHRSGLQFVLNEAPEKIDQAVLADLEQDYFQEVFDMAQVYELYVLKD